MSHDYGCKIDSRAFRINQLAHRICKAESRSAGLQWRRDLRRAISELMDEVDARCDALPAGTATSQRGHRRTRVSEQHAPDEGEQDDG